MKPLCTALMWATAVSLAGCGDGKDTPAIPEPPPGPGTETVDFTAVSSTAVVDDAGLLDIELTSAAGDRMFLRMVPLQGYAGDYAVSAGDAPGTVLGAAEGENNDASWYLPAGKQRKLWISEGSVSVAADGSEGSEALTLEGVLGTSGGTDIRLSAPDVRLPEQPAEPLRFTALSGAYTLNGSLLDVTFSDGGDARMFLSLDISAGLSGKFTVRHGGGPGSIAGANGDDTEGASWYLPAGDAGTLFFVSGEAEASFAEGDPLTVTFAGRLTVADGREVEVKAESLALTEMEALAMTVGEIMYYGPNDNETGLFFLYLKDGEGSDMKHNMGLYVNTEPVTDPTDLHIPSGEYVRNEGNTPAYSLNAAEGQTLYNSFWWSTRPEPEQYMAVDAGMTVSRSGDIYTVEGFLMSGPYKGVTFSFTGKLPAEDYS